MAMNGVVPEHVDPGLVRQFDFYNDERYVQAGGVYEGIDRLRAEGAPGIFYTPEYGGHWVIHDHELVFQAARATDIFTSRLMGIPAPPGAEEQFAPPITIDPPMHDMYRKPIVQAFTPKLMQALEAEIKALAIHLVDQFAGDGRCDFVAAIAEPMPVMIFMKMMGMPLERLHDFRALVPLCLLNQDEESRMAAMGQVAGEMWALIEQRKIKREDDLISMLVDIQIDGRPVTDEECIAYATMIFFAGLDTVTNAMSFGVLRLAKDQALQAHLRENPKDIVTASEELLRCHAPAQPTRGVTRDVEWNGVRFAKRDRVLLFLAAANRDPKAFDRPTEVDLQRKTPHMAFNAGPHRCLGSHLARMEMQIMYAELLKRVPPFRLDPDKQPRYHGGIVIGMEELPLVWDVG